MLLHSILGGIVMLAVAIPWHAYMLKTHGEQFREAYLVGQVLGRITGRPPESVVADVHGTSASLRPFFYAPVLFHSMFPWSLLSLPAVLLALVTAVRYPNREVRLLTLWFLVFAATITIANAKFPWYAVPLLPTMALLVAWFVDRVGRGNRKVPVYVGGVTVLALSLFWTPSPDYDPYARVAPLWPHRDRSLVAVTALTRSDLTPWIPLAANAVFFATVGALVLRNRNRERQQGLGAVRIVVGSLLITGACHVVLPLRGADNRSHFTQEFATCSEVLRERGLAVKRVLILDDETLDLAFKWAAFFYFYEISGGSGGQVSRLVDGHRNWQDRQVLRPGVVLLGQPRWAVELRAADRFQEIHSGPLLYAAYVP
jgi:hypothetical protein